MKNARCARGLFLGMLLPCATPALAGAGNGSDVKTATQGGTGCKQNGAVENWIATDGSELRFQIPDLKSTGTRVNCETTIVVTHKGSGRLKPKALTFAASSSLAAGAAGDVAVSYHYKDKEQKAGGALKVDKAGDTAMHDEVVKLTPLAGDCGSQTTIVIDVSVGVTGAQPSKVKLTRLAMLALDWESCGK